MLPIRTVLLVAIVAAFVYAWHAEPHPLDRDGDGVISVLALGDSNTYRFNRGAMSSWPERLQNLLRARMPTRPAVVFNMGFGAVAAHSFEGSVPLQQGQAWSAAAVGASPTGLEFLMPHLSPLVDLPSRSPDFIVVAYGTNDVTYLLHHLRSTNRRITNEDLAPVVDTHEAIARRLQTAFPHAMILIGNTPPRIFRPGEPPSTPAKRSRERKSYKRFVRAERAGGILNDLLSQRFGDAVIDFSAAAQGRPEVYSDTLHFNDEGQQIRAETVWEKIARRAASPSHD